MFQSRQVRTLSSTLAPVRSDIPLKIDESSIFARLTKKILGLFIYLDVSICLHLSLSIYLCVFRYRYIYIYLYGSL